LADVTGQSIAERGRDALGRHAWSEAYELLSDADATSALAPDELELLADASWWVGKLPDAIEARERAFAGYVRAGNPVMAAAAASALGQQSLLRGTYSVAAAWLNRAERHLAGIDDTVVHGWLAVVRAFQLGLEGKFDEALAASERAGALATTFADRNLGALALSTEGLSRIHLGDVERGLTQVDEATIAAVGGEVEPAIAGGVCCSTIEACAALGDWKRAAQWTEAQDRWCRREHINGFPGMCRVFRAEIKRLGGDWLTAESEARRATDELAGFMPAAVGMALYEIGIIRLRRGDLPAAKEALTRAHALGRHPEPALSLVLLAEGNVDAALTSIRRALDEPDPAPSWGARRRATWAASRCFPPRSRSRWPRAIRSWLAARRNSWPISPAAVRPSRRRRRRPRPRATCSSPRVTRPPPPAPFGARLSNGRTWTRPTKRRGRGSPSRWHTPASGDAGPARMEMHAAQEVLERLGAVADVRRAADTLESIGEEGASSAGSGQSSGPVRAARTFVFTDIVDSTRLNETLGDEAWGALIRWHDGTIRSLAAEHGGEEIKATGDGFFLAFPDTDDAIETAIAIQRRFDEQRRSQGFAPALRIGVHRAEANRTGLDHTGSGVNLAARVESAATGGEILISGETLRDARRSFREADRRTVELKGISAPVDVVAIDWR
jgi:class 3 adenylate cyclase/tetratricopeptide (TPR) repeat protein